MSSTWLCSDAGSSDDECAADIGALILVWSRECACIGCLMLELLFWHVSVPAWGAECSAVLAVVWACPAWGVDCLDVLKPKAVGWCLISGLDYSALWQVVRVRRLLKKEEVAKELHFFV